MNREHLKLHEFRVTVGAPSHNLPACREVTYSLVLADEQRKVVWEHAALVYEGLLADSDQVPWLVAHALRTLFREGSVE
jgi:hypothetical protein